MELIDMHDIIEDLRQEMVNEAMVRGLLDEKVIALSQKLDKYIVLYQKLKVGKLKPRSKCLSRVG